MFQIQPNSKLIIIFLFILAACQKEGTVNAKVYRRGDAVRNYYGFFYSTKYGGLNYYIPNRKDREALFDKENIDSIIFNIGNKQYLSKPLVSKSFSREKNDSEFSYYINENDHKIFITKIGRNLNTLLLVPEKKGLKILKEGIIKHEYIDN